MTSTAYRVAKTHTIPYLYRSFPAKVIVATMHVYTSVYGSVYVNVYVHVFSENVILVDLTCLYVMGSET